MVSMKKATITKVGIFTFMMIGVTLLGSPVGATGETPPPLPIACIDVEKYCTDAAGPDEPILYSGVVTNCGDVDLVVVVKDITTGEVPIRELPMAPGESESFNGLYYPAECGPSTNEVSARATYEVIDSKTGEILLSKVFDEDSATCEVPCDGDKGCTLTPGYWKTHSAYGPAPYDAIWAMIGEDTPFFMAGASYYEVLWTEPKGGNAYYILAHAYIAADLNILSGASMPDDVMDAFNGATEVFGLYTPDEIGELKGKDDLRKSFIGMAKILDKYNNGDLGPGHCND
jgi:hypothetical protein